MKRKLNNTMAEDEGFQGELKENPFQVPEGYFENFRERLNKKIEAEGWEGKTPLKRLSRRTWLAAAAAVVILVTGSVMLIKNHNKTEADPLTSITLTLQDLEASFTLEGFDEYTLVNFYLENSEQVPGSANEPLSDHLRRDTTITESDIEQYLLQSNELENLLLNL